MQQNIVATPSLAPEGQRKIEWVRRNMPILRELEAQFAAERPFAGKRIAVSIHLEAKTAYLALVLRAGKTDLKMAKAKLSVLDQLPVEVTGAVLNEIDTEGQYQYYSYDPEYTMMEEPAPTAGAIGSGSGRALTRTER